jgi:uncharacterized protein (TIGR03086 family)
VALVPTDNNVPTDNDLLDQLTRSFAAVGDVIGKVPADKWTAPTPCPDWTVTQVVGHLAGMNRVFAAMLADQSAPRRGGPDDEPERAFRESAAALLLAFAEPGVLDRTFRSPLGAATGAERLQIRLYDLLAHGWDISRAIGQPAQLPDDAAEQALAFARNQLRDDARPGRFAAAQALSAAAPALDRLVAFLGRRPDWAG